MKFLCENIAFVLNNNYKKYNFAHLLIGHKYAHLKSDAFSLDMSIYRSPKTVLNHPVNGKIQGLFKAFVCVLGTFQGKINLQGLFKTVLYIQVLFKPV